MVAQHYRWDFIGLSTDQKPTPATSEKVVDGSTFYCSDNSKLYVYYKDQWYEKEATGGGASYTAGNGIAIADDTISVDPTYVATMAELDARINKGEGTPTTATEGVVGGLYEDTTNGKLYICTAVTAGVDPDPDTYTWEEVGAGGGGSSIKILTPDDYNWNSSTGTTDNPNCVALWLLPAGWYGTDNRNSSNITKVYATSSLEATNSYTLFGVAYTPYENGYVRIYLFNTGTGESKTTGADLIRTYTVWLTNGYGNFNNSAATFSQLVSMGIRTLSIYNDLNYPQNNPDGFAPFKRGAGHFQFTQATKIYLNTTDTINDFIGTIDNFQYTNSSQQSVKGFKVTSVTTGEIYIGEAQDNGTKVFLNKVNTTAQ